jgi:threonine synthase
MSVNDSQEPARSLKSLAFPVGREQDSDLPLPHSSLYDSITQRIVQICGTTLRPIWVLIEAYHGGGKTHITEQIKRNLEAIGLHCLALGLDISWTDRCDRARWREEAYAARARGQPHPYFDALGQNPPLHWRKAHSDAAISALEKAAADARKFGRPVRVALGDCYQFNETGDICGVAEFTVMPHSVILVEGAYASALQKTDWDLRVYILADREQAKRRAMTRDEWKVHRCQTETCELYEDVYEPTYDRYLALYRPIKHTDIMIDARTTVLEGLPHDRGIAQATPFQILLECSNLACRHQMPALRVDACPICKGALQNTIVGEVRFPEVADEAYPGMWRYHRLMPVHPGCISGEHVGTTPVVYLPETSAALGIQLWVKLEIVNPTGTFKDREGAYVVAISRQFGQDNIVLQSTGNTAVAVTHYAGLAGLSSWAFIPKSSAYKLLMPPRRPSSHIIAVDGHPIDVKRLADEFAAQYDFPKISPFHERCEANATLAYEIAEAILSRTLPAQELLPRSNFDFYVQTIAAGMGPVGFYTGMERLQRWTHGELTMPRILAVEIAEFAPIQNAWEKGLPEVGEEVATPYFPNHDLFEPTLWTTNIRKYYPCLRRMLMASHGLLTAVTPHQVQTAEREFGIREELTEMGYCFEDTERASFVGFAGLVEQVKSHEIKRGSCVILMLTGKGHHDTFVHEQPDFTADSRVHKPADILAAVAAG